MAAALEHLFEELELGGCEREEEGEGEEEEGYWGEHCGWSVSCGIWLLGWVLEGRGQLGR